MGIKALLMYLKGLSPEIVQALELSEMKGYRIAVDVAVLAYQKKSQYISKTSYKLDLVNEEIDYKACTNYMIRHILRILDAILVAGCIPVVVMDGKAPDLKHGTKKDRAAKSNKKRHNIAELRRLCKGLLGKEPFTLTEDDVAFLQTFKTPIKTIEDMKRRLEIEIKQYITVSPSDYLLLASICNSMGLPHVIAESEAEQTCSQMARHRDVLAIFTTDSDCLVYGCPIMINKITITEAARIQSSPKIECYSFNNVLKVIGLTNSQFIDFCIMCGTDFNKNSPGFGPKENMKLLMAFGSIPKMIEVQNILKEKIKTMPVSSFSREELSLLRFDISVLNYNAVRCFFTRPVSYDKNALKIRVEENQYEKAFEHLNVLMGAVEFMQIQDVCKSIIERLHKVARFAR